MTTIHNSNKTNTNGQATKKHGRERGTLQHTLPKPALILLIFFIGCTTIASLICFYSGIGSSWNTTNLGGHVKHTGQHRTIDFDISFKAALGVISSMIGFLYTDPWVHYLFVTVTQLHLTLFLPPGDEEHVNDTSRSVSAPANFLMLVHVSLGTMLALILCFWPMLVLKKIPLFVNKIQIPRIQKILMSKSTNDVASVQRRNMLAIYLPVFVATLVECSHRILIHGQSEDTSCIISAPTMLIVAASVFIHEGYYRCRSHKHGNLMVHQQGTPMMVSLLLVLSTILVLIGRVSSTVPVSCQDILNRTVFLLPFWIGAVTASTAVAYFTSIDDAWYAVGTGQFQMIVLDAAGIGFYFILPLVVLSLRFMAKYGSHVHHAMSLAGNILRDSCNPMSSWIFLQLGGNRDLDVRDHSMLAHVLLVIQIVNVVAWGIPMVNSLCPVSGYLFGKTYIHGRPNTQKNAVSVDYRTLYDENVDAKERDAFWEELKSTSPPTMLNINIAASDLLKCRGEVEKLYAQGHEFAIIVDPSCKFGLKESISVAFYAFRDVFDGKTPNWYHTGRNAEGSMPQCHRMAFSLGLRTAVWSSCITSADDVSCLKEELKDHKGGLLVYVCSKDNILGTLRSIIATMTVENFTLTTLSSVVSTENRMNL